MNLWSFVFTGVALALIFTHIIELFFPYSPMALEECTCLRWKSRTEPSGYRVVRDTNCPVHTEG